ncbi:hypothetical protein FUT14_21490 [Bacillus toyonensis]|nr:hypothetical protein A6J74_30170 [Bacillus sp. FDAARGOS_235]MBE7167813.1 hypothetical protein [Bacillus toyonensis]QWH45927.1 hypothetical protein EXW64_16730 [Bacillus toyonensis]
MINSLQFLNVDELHVYPAICRAVRPHLNIQRSKEVKLGGVLPVKARLVKANVEDEEPPLIKVSLYFFSTACPPNSLRRAATTFPVNVSLSNER